jgi:hypothetical protein
MCSCAAHCERAGTPSSAAGVERLTRCQGAGVVKGGGAPGASPPARCARTARRRSAGRGRAARRARMRLTGAAGDALALPGRSRHVPCLRPPHCKARSRAAPGACFMAGPCPPKRSRPGHALETCEHASIRQLPHELSGASALPYRATHARRGTSYLVSVGQQPRHRKRLAGACARRRTHLQPIAASATVPGHLPRRQSRSAWSEPENCCL